MNPAATNHTVSTRHDLELAQRYVAYRNAVLWPTRKLQRLLTVGVIAAVGFIFQPGLVRYASWVVALVILFWLLVADAVTARASLVADPARKGSGIEEYQFSSRGFRLDNTSDARWRSYDDVRSIHSDGRYWILGMKSGDAVLLAQDGVDGGETSPPQFESFLMARTKLGVEPVNTSVSAKIQRAEQGRRGYLDAHPSKIAQLLNSRVDRRAHRDDS
jgi:hypothetical protein